MDTAIQIDGWIIKGCYAEPIRIAKSGNIVNAECGMACYWNIIKKQPKPTIYSTKEAAETVINAKVNSCQHDYRMISHEEMKCRKCGNIVFSPDD